MFALVATAMALEIEPCARYADLTAAVAEVDGGGQAVVISPEGYALTTRFAVDGRSTVPLELRGHRVDAELVSVDQEGRALLRFDPPQVAWETHFRCAETGAPQSGLVFRVRDGDIRTGTVEGDEPYLTSFESKPGIAILEAGGVLVALTDGSGDALLAEPGFEEALGFSWGAPRPPTRFEQLEDATSGAVRVWLFAGGWFAALLLLAVLLARRIGSATGRVRGARSHRRPGLPWAWRALSEQLGLEVKGHSLVGERDGHRVVVDHLDGWTRVQVRCDPPEGLQVLHASRRANVRAPVQLANPVVGRLLAVGGPPDAAEWFHDEALLAAACEVVHAHPTSSVDDEGVTLRSEGLHVETLDHLVCLAVDLARRLEALS